MACSLVLSKGLPSSSCGEPQPLLSKGLPSSSCGEPQPLLSNSIIDSSCLQPWLDEQGLITTLLILVGDLPSFLFASQALHTGQVRVEGLPSSGCGGPQHLLFLGRVLPINGCVLSQASKGEWRSCRMQFTTQARLAVECWVQGLPSSSCGKPQLLLGAGHSVAGCGFPRPIFGNWRSFWIHRASIAWGGLQGSSCGEPQLLLGKGHCNSSCGGPQLLLSKGLPSVACGFPQSTKGEGQSFRMCCASQAWLACQCWAKGQ